MSALEEQDRNLCTGFFWLWTGTSDELLWTPYETSSSIKGRNFLTTLVTAGLSRRTPFRGIGYRSSVVPTLWEG